MADTEPRPTLLGIPPELRLQIYDYVRHSDPEYAPIKSYNRYSVREQSQHSFEAMAERSNQCLRLLWLDLMLACRTLAAELRVFISRVDKPAATVDAASNAIADANMAPEDRTYVIDLELYGNIRRLTWRHLLCPPTDVQILRVRCSFVGADRPHDFIEIFWGDGGPASIVRSLYHSLNCLLHCGPRLDVAKPLPQDIYLRELIIEVDEEHQEYKPRGRGDSIYSNVEFLSRVLLNHGVLFGYVDLLRITCKGSDIERVIRKVEGAAVRAKLSLWADCGYEWGVRKST